MHTEQVLNAATGALPQEVATAILGSSALLVLRQNDAGELVMNATVMEGAFLPETNIAHAFVAQVYAEFKNLTAGVHNGTTDAMRYRGMRDFALLANTDEARFEALNAMLQAFEEDNGYTEADKRSAADCDAIADFMCLALAETEPKAPA